MSIQPLETAAGVVVIHTWAGKKFFGPGFAVMHNDFAKSLILLMLCGCLQNVHSVETRMLARFWPVKRGLSTKLFTDIVDIEKKLFHTAT